MRKSSPAFRILAAVTLWGLVGTPSDAAYISPQVDALEALRAESSTPVEVAMDRGFPRHLRFTVPAVGVGAIAQAFDFVDRYAPLYRQGGENLRLELMRSQELDGLDVISLFQTYRGYVVVGSELKVVIDDDPTLGSRLLWTSGALMPDADIDTIPAFDEGTAEDYARTERGNPGAIVQGVTALMVYDPYLADAEADPRLVYRVTLADSDLTQFFIDANTGELVLSNPLSRAGAGLDDYDFDLQDANGGNILSTNCFNPTTIDDTIGDEDGVGASWVSNPEVGAAFWGAREAYQYYHDVFGYHSWDNDDDEVTIYLFAGGLPGAPNGRWVRTCGIEFSPGHISKDVVAHEFTHAIVGLTSELVYQNQSGALDESFADTMASMVDDQDWLIGEGLLDGTGPSRSLKNPPALGDPDRMADLNPTTSDNGGVHTNAGIPNKAAYLMAEGGTHYGRAVAGMGRLKTARVIFAAMRNMAKTAQFIDLRNYAVNYAAYLASGGTYGFTDADTCTVRNAYRAVGLGEGDFDCDGVEDDVDDEDNDGVLDIDDNCPNDPNPLQFDSDHDGEGDVCETDNDNDGKPNNADNCIDDFNPSQLDFDGDGMGNVCDDDNDNDGILDDGDSSGTPGDNRCASGVTSGCDDNCPYDANADQFDGNSNGFGDACDPDQDGDGFYVDDDNCTFVYNPGQENADGDEFGDACDDCPNDEDLVNAYTPGFPELGIDPQPYQPDSDGDGIPDVCDPFPYGQVAWTFDGVVIDPAFGLDPNGARRTSRLRGPAGASFSIPFAACELGPSDGIGADQRIEVTMDGLPSSVDVRIDDGSGQTVARMSNPGRDRRGPALPLRGLRIQPRCDTDYYLAVELGDDFSGTASPTVVADLVQAGARNPWTASAGSSQPAPEREPDEDGDGLSDDIDKCPGVYDPDRSDLDDDQVGDACDPCTRGTGDGKTLVKLKKLGGSPGSQSFLAAGKATAADTAAAIDPSADGIGLLIATDSGVTVLDERLPGGAYDDTTRKGWKVNRAGTSFLYKGDGEFAGIFKVKLNLSKTPGEFRFKFVGKDTDLSAPSGDLPLFLRTVLVDPAPPVLACAESTFAGPGNCKAKGGGKTIACR